MNKEQFANYVASFYHPDCDPVYCFDGLTMESIYEAIDLMLGDYTGELIGDSVDREAVANILTTQLGYEYPPAKYTPEQLVSYIKA